MISGSYPCCGGDLWLSMPADTPSCAPEDCPHCGAKVWHVFSRIDPRSYTDADFREQYDVNDETRAVRAKVLAE